WLTVVGIVSNISQNDPTRQQFDPTVYLPFRQRPGGDIGIVARTRVTAESITSGFQRELQAIDPTVPFQHLAPATTWMSMVGGAFELQRNVAALFTVFGGVALVLASAGLYSVVAQSVSRRTQEIGIRAALGATANDIRNLVFRQEMLP